MKAILFDLFGVLAGPVYSLLIEKYILEAERAEWLGKLDLLDLGTLSEAELLKQMSERTSIAIEVLRREASDKLAVNERLFDFVETELSGRYLLGLLTNAPRDLVDRLIGDRLSIFDVIIVSSDVHLIKPDPRIFELTLAKAGCAAEEALFVDDRQGNIEAAQKLGLQGIVYRDFTSFKSQLDPMLAKGKA